mmetsp:Transcript_2910/g.2443  ORF Transcript_2910/g.2443 Transcript_2910/m.2443 type:complete len:221 (+) Transcript_2910:93-755(+)
MQYSSILSFLNYILIIIRHHYRYGLFMHGSFGTMTGTTTTNASQSSTTKAQDTHDNNDQYNNRGNSKGRQTVDCLLFESAQFVIDITHGHFVGRRIRNVLVVHAVRSRFVVKGNVRFGCSFRESGSWFIRERIVGHNGSLGGPESSICGINSTRSNIIWSVVRIIWPVFRIIWSVFRIIWSIFRIFRTVFRIIVAFRIIVWSFNWSFNWRIICRIYIYRR